MSSQDCRVLADVSDLLVLANRWRGQHLSIGFTCGAFDLLHAGHVNYLEKAKSLCDRLVVGVNSDDSIRQYKSPHRPIISQEHRMYLVAALRSVDAVILMNETRPAALLSSLRPDLYVKGGDYGKEQLKSAPLVESYGGRCEVIPIEYEISSSLIMSRVQEMSLYASPEPISLSRAPIVFLDRDGTLIEDVSFLKDVRRVKVKDTVGDGLRLLQNQGFRLVIVTNQQGIGLGYLTYDDFIAVNSAMLRQLAKYDVKISKFYYCPHSLADNCDCRKPAAKLIKRALSDFSAQPERCFMIGDAESDITAAESAGCTGIMVTSTKEGLSTHAAPSFLEAARLILKLKKQSNS